jgi:hypothetical protein
MGSSLTGTKINQTYDSLIKVSDNGALDGTLQTLTDGLGNDSALSLSTAGASVTGTLSVSGGITGTLSTAAQTNITSVGTLSSLAVSGNLTVDTNTLFVDAANNRVGIGTDVASGGSLTIYGSNASTVYQTPSSGTGAVKGFYIGHTADVSYLYNYQSHPMVFATNNTERMRIDSSGNVGIGESNPENDNRLHIKYSDVNVTPFSSSPLVIERNDICLVQTLTSNASDAGILFGDIDDNDVGGLFYAHSSNAMTFRTNTSERMRITSGGDVLIGKLTTGASGTKGIEFAALGSVSVVNDFADNVGESIFLNRNSGTGLFLRLRKSNSDVGSISTNGTSTAFNTTSDYRLKEDWQPMEGALDRVDALKPINFAWKSDGSRVDGFLAHELAEVIPEAVTGEKDATEIRSVEISPAVYEDVIHPAEDAVYETIEHPAIAEELDEEGNVLVEAQEAWTEEVLVSEDKEEWVEKVLVSEAVFEDQEFPVYQGIDQSKVVPLLVAGLQEAHNLIKELKAEIELLKA